MAINFSLSLQQLDGEIWPVAPKNAAPFIKRCHALRKMPLSNFSTGDLRLMIGQQLGLIHVLPLALQFLEAYPLLRSEFYEGDLLSNVLTIDWKDHALRQYLPRTIAIAKHAHLLMMEEATSNLLDGYSPEELGLSKEALESVEKLAVQNIKAAPWDELVSFLEIHG
jgi:CDI immunity proteins